MYVCDAPIMVHTGSDHCTFLSPSPPPPQAHHIEVLVCWFQ